MFPNVPNFQWLGGLRFLRGSKGGQGGYKFFEVSIVLLEVVHFNCNPLDPLLTPLETLVHLAIENWEHLGTFLSSSL